MMCLKLPSWVIVFCAGAHEHITKPRRNAKLHFTVLVSVFRCRSEQLLLPSEGCANHSAMLDKHLCHCRGGIRSCPVALNLCAENHPSNRDCTRLNHPLNCHLVCRLLLEKKKNSNNLILL